ncbi:MAG: efflux RND transporter permease subunit [Pseudomonadales bacterium]|nr:efflux RND transporter permease subunit [Pseudomonadales bacterium]
MKGLIAFSLRQKVFFNLLFVILMIAGAYALSQLPTERYPNVHFGEVIISTYLPGASPEEVETLITNELEDALDGVEDVEWITATSFRERSHIRLKFYDDSDYEKLFNEVRFEVLNVQGHLPEAADPSQVFEATISDYLPVMVVNLVGDHENRMLALMADDIKTQLAKISGVKEIKISGEYVREFHVYLDPNRLTQFGITYGEVVNALQSTNVNIPAGDFKSESGQYVVIVDERFRAREQVVNTIVRKASDGSFVRVRDLLSRAELAYRDPLVISSVNGQGSIAIEVLKTAYGNALDIKQQVQELVDSHRSVLKKEGVEVVYTQDSTVQIRGALSTLLMNMALGIILVTLIIWYFMGVRNALLITIGIPFSFMITMLLMYLSSNTLNEITLFSFVLVTGIIVDDAIVVTENIYRHIQEGDSLYDAIVFGTAEVAVPVISATMTTVSAFLPMLIMTGPTGEFFAQIPIAVTFAILASLIECLFILPIHYLDFGPRRKPNKSAQHIEKENTLMRGLQSITAKVLAVTMRHRAITVTSVLAAFIASVIVLILSISGIAPLIKIKFFPDDYSLFYVDVEGPSNAAIETIDVKVREISEFIVSNGPGYAASATGYAGFYINEDYEPIYGNNYGAVMITLPAKDVRTYSDPISHLSTIENDIRKQFEDEKFRINLHPQNEGPPTGKDINIKILGADAYLLEGLAEELLNYLNTNDTIAPHLVDLEDNRGDKNNVFRFSVDHDKANELAINSSAVAQLAASVLDGQYIGKYRVSDDEVDLKIYVDPDKWEEPEDALNLPLVAHAVGNVRLGDVTNVETYNELGQLNRYDGQRAISISADITPGSPISTPFVVNQVLEFYQQVRTKYPGANLIIGGEHEDTRRSYQSLTYAFVIAMLIIYLILATQFQSYFQPLIIISAIIFALIGVIFGKLVTQSIFTVNSFIATIGVAGVVVNDALVLIDFINKNHRNGMSRKEAIEEGVRVRLRPIVLTTLTTTLGLLPMAIGIPDYSLVWGTMASTFVTGLATATALTLFVVPIFWDLLQEQLDKKASTSRDLKSGV